MMRITVLLAEDGRPATKSIDVGPRVMRNRYKIKKAGESLISILVEKQIWQALMNPLVSSSIEDHQKHCCSSAKVRLTLG